MHWRRPGLVCAALGAAAIGLTAFAGHAAAVTAQDTITTVIGTGVAGNAASGAPGTTQLNAPRGLSIIFSSSPDPIAVADTGNDRVFAGIAPSGLLMPSDVISGESRNVIVSDTGHHRIVGQVHPLSGAGTRAGTGVAGFSGDGGPADQAQLSSPGGITQSAAGLYIADTGNNRIRLIQLNQFPSTITTVAGEGSAGFSGDGGPAGAAALNAPLDVALDEAGTTLYIADTANHRVRKVAPDGTITTVAGTGSPGFSGDGGLAAQAQLNAPSGVEVDQVGNLYIADTANHRVRKVATDGTITTVAGSDAATEVGDDGPAGQARLVSPWGLAADGQGNLFVADQGDHRVRKISNALPTAVMRASVTQGLAPIEVHFDASGSSDSDGRITSYRWRFGSGAFGTDAGPRISQFFSSPGEYTAGLLVTDDSGVSASAALTITIGPELVPGGLVLGSAQIRGNWRASRLVGGELSVAGGVNRAETLNVAMLRGGRTVAQTTFSSPAGGPFTRTIALGPRTAPGSYTVRLAQVGATAGPLPIREITVSLSAPPEGLASRATLGRLSRRLVARFSLTSLPRSGRPLVVRWIAPGSRRPVAVHTARSGSVVLDRLPLPPHARPGIWRAELRWGSRVVAAVSRRVPAGR
jgi:sugar lactone lactonase YvrE